MLVSLSDGFWAFAEWRGFESRANSITRDSIARSVSRKLVLAGLKSLGSHGPVLFRKTNCRIENKRLKEGCFGENLLPILSF